MGEMIISIIGGAIAAGLSGFSWLFFFKQDKAAKEINNEAKQSEEWRKLYEETHEELKERDLKIDELYVQINMHRDQHKELQKENTSLSVENTKLKLMMCTIPACPKRQPPTGY